MAGLAQLILHGLRGPHRLPCVKGLALHGLFFAAPNLLDPWGSADLGLQKKACAFQRRAGDAQVIPAGFEPATVGLEDRCSIQLSYGTFFIKRHKVTKKIPIFTPLRAYADNASTPLSTTPTTDNRQLTTDNRQPTTDNRQPTTDHASGTN